MNPKLLALVEAARAKHAAAQAAKQQQTTAGTAGADTSNPSTFKQSNVVSAISTVLSDTDKHAQTSKLSFNPEQLAAIELGLQGKSFCLIGAAGTGKTTVTQELIARLQRAAHMRPLADSTKHLNQGAPGIVICGFTNKAVNNIRKKLPTNLQGHCITIHKLLEYAPTYYEVVDDEGQMKTTMRFEPSRFAGNPLPHISTIIFEESSMIGTDLYKEVLEALPRPSSTQFIFLGDLNQIPPVFGPSILGFKLAELLTVELTHVYRQALESPIISLATAIRTASDDVPVSLTTTVKTDKGDHGNLTIHPWKKRIDKDSAILVMKNFLNKMIDSKEYNPAEDMILCPFNKSFGTVELNKIIADKLAKDSKATVFEVIARYTKSYWAVGDRVLVDRHEAVITKITNTVGYVGKLPRTESATLDRWGYDPESDTPTNELTADQILNVLDSLGGSEDDEAKNLASHTITVYFPDLDESRDLNTAGEINSMLLGYCLTIHKSQGSEWQRVFLFLHDSHATMISRELIYTAVTRAKHSLYIVCEGNTSGKMNSLERAAQRPIIPGITLQEKIAYFADKANSMRSIADTN